MLNIVLLKFKQNIIKPFENKNIYSDTSIRQMNYEYFVEKYFIFLMETNIYAEPGIKYFFFGHTGWQSIIN